MADEIVTADTTTSTPVATAALVVEGTGAAADAGKTEAAALTVDAGAAAEAAKTAEAEKTKAAETKAAEAAPVDYAKVIAAAALPEGMTIDPALAKTGSDMFAKHKVSPEAAKEFVELFAQQQKAGADGNAKVFAEQVQSWKTEAEKTTTPAEQDAAKKAALTIFGKDEMMWLEASGTTNRLGFIKTMAKLAKDTGIVDDQFVPGNAGGGGGPRDSRAMFPNTPGMNP